MRLESIMNIPEWTKPAAYGVAAGAIAMAIVGFSWGGWVTGSTADEMAATASRDASERLVASICVERFLAAPSAAGQLVALKEVKSWEQDSFIEDGGWIHMQFLDQQVTGAADLCADQLVAMESVPEIATEPVAATTKPVTTGG